MRDNAIGSLRTGWRGSRGVGWRRGLVVFGAALFGLLTVSAPARAAGPSGDLAGYVAQGTGFTSMTGSWIEPSAVCRSSQDLLATWLGLDGWGSSTVEQTGVAVDCQSGAPVYEAWYELYPAAPVYWNVVVRPGDVLTTTVDRQQGITLTDSTAGWTESVRHQLGGTGISAEAVVEFPTGTAPKFDRLTFTGLTVDGTVFDDFAPTPLQGGGCTTTALLNGSFSVNCAGLGGD